VHFEQVERTNFVFLHLRWAVRSGECLQEGIYTRGKHPAAAPTALGVHLGNGTRAQ